MLGFAEFCERLAMFSVFSLHSIMMPRVTAPFLWVFFHPYTAKCERNMYVLLAIIIPKIFLMEMERNRIVVTLLFFSSANCEVFCCCCCLLHFYIPTGRKNFVLCCFPGLALE